MRVKDYVFRPPPPGSLIRNRQPVGPYSRTMPRLLWRSKGGSGFLWARYPCKETVIDTNTAAIHAPPLQGNLAHKKQPHPVGPP